MDYRKACEILEVVVDEEFDVIKRKYLSLIKFYHPDNYQENEEKRQYAEEKTKQLNDAWEYIQANYSDREQLTRENPVVTSQQKTLRLENPFYKSVITTPVVVISIVVIALISLSLLSQCLPEEEKEWRKYSEEDAALLQDFDFILVNDGYAIQGKGTDFAAKVAIPSAFDGSSVTVIAEYAFADCKEITEIFIPNGIAAIKRGAFSNCDKLTSVAIPDSVSEIEDIAIGSSGAFEGCDNLEVVYVGKGISALTYFTFAECKALKELYISDSVNLIEAYTFIECPSMEKIYFVGTLEQWEAVQVHDNAFDPGLVIEIYCTDGMTTYPQSELS